MFMCAIGIAGLVFMALPNLALAQGNSQADTGQQISGTTASSVITSNLQGETNNRLDLISLQQFEMSSKLGEVSSGQKASSTLSTVFLTVLGISVAIFIFLFNILHSRLLKLETKIDTGLASFDTKIDTGFASLDS
jgi:hypothetical protein